ncbi:MAG: MBL fold metallo-hydrolase [Oscillospiraceae bacterium]|nr:MBL fold metallo-hydrolase [Oscillospiraceae bacterium]
MEYQIIQINHNTWRIEDNGVRFFLLAGEERALLVDSGRDVRNAREIAESLTDLPLSLINTHADGDHVACNGQFESFYMHPAEEPNYRRGDRPGTILPVQEGDVLDLGGRPLEIIHIPGHTPGSIALLDIADRVLISGDPVQDGRIFMFGPFRNMENYIRSLEHLQNWAGRFDEVWPSHASFPVSPELIGKLYDGAQDILAGKVSCSSEELYGKRILAFDLGFATFLCDA